MSAAARRITKEYAELQQDFPPHVTAAPDESNLLHWVRPSRFLAPQRGDPPLCPRADPVHTTRSNPDWHHHRPARLVLQGCVLSLASLCRLELS